MKRTAALIILIFSLAVAACGDDGSNGVEETASTEAPVATTNLVTSTTATPVLAEPVPLAVVAETGGCFMLGPNCSTTLIMSDGTFGVFRTDPADVLAVPDDIAAADITGQVDVGALARTVSDTDFSSLRSQLEPGTCQGCVDGIDVTVRFHTAEGVEDLSSVEYDFDSDIDLFQYLQTIQTVIRDSGDLEPLPRGA